MPEITAKLRISGNMILYWCQGCEEAHSIRYGAEETWQWDGNRENPTFSPSVLIRSGHYCTTHKPGGPCWCTYRDRLGKPAHFKCQQCHTFIRNGMVEFLPDCSHQYAGQTLPLPDLPERLRDPQ